MIRVAGQDCVLVPDCSQYQGHIDFDRLAQSWVYGYFFGDEKIIVLKLSEGNGLVDPVAAANVQAARAHGWLVIGYHYARPDRNPDDAGAEARFVAAKAKELGCSAVMLDFEEASLSPGELSAWRARFVDVLFAEMPGCPHGLYEGAYLPVAADPGLASRVWLCVPNYRLGYQADPDPRQFTSWPPLPPGFSSLGLWQYTSTAHVPGIGGSSVDMSAGTAAWVARVKNAPVQEEDDMPYKDWSDDDKWALANDVAGLIVGRTLNEKNIPSPNLGSLSQAQLSQFQALCQLVADAAGKPLTWDQGTPKIG